MRDFMIFTLDTETESDHMYIGACTKKGSMIGLLCFTPGDDVFSIDYIYTYEEYRNKGVATALMDSFLEAAKDAGAREIRGCIPDGRSSGQILGFFEHRSDFTIARYEVLRRITPMERSHSREWKKLLEMEAVSDEFFDLPIRQRNHFMMENGIFNEPDTPFDAGLCFVLCSKQIIKAAVFGMVLPDREVCLQGIYGSSKWAVCVLADFAKALEDRYGDLDLVIPASDRKLTGLAERLFTDMGTSDHIWEIEYGFHL
jgi:GNAT superfamily N-acetyltransferase